jgi:uncharacterized protein YybS (DUF2232 family)
MGLGLVLLEAGTPRGWLSVVTALVSLVPVALAFALGGPLAAGMAVVVAVAAAAALLGGSTAVVVALKHALPGLSLGLVLARRASLPTSLVLVSATSMLALAGLLWVFAPAGMSPLALLQRQLDAHVADLEQLPSRLGMASDPGWAADSARDSARMVASTLRVAGPGIVLVGLLMGALVNYVVARLCVRGDGFRPFSDEAVPDHLVWGVIVGGLLVAARHSGLEPLGINLLIVLAPLYAIQGLAVLRHFFKRVRVPRALQVVSFGLFAVQPLMLIAVACVGLSDLWIDFRKIRQAPTAA